MHNTIRRGAQFEHMPDLSGHARRFAGVEQKRAGIHGMNGACVQLHHQPVQPIRTQELRVMIQLVMVVSDP